MGKFFCTHSGMSKSERPKSRECRKPNNRSFEQIIVRISGMAFFVQTKKAAKLDHFIKNKIYIKLFSLALKVRILVSPAH